MKHEKTNAPSLGQRLLCSLSDGETLPGDMQEVYAQLCYERGQLNARVWYWTEFFRALPGLFIFNLEISLWRQTVSGNIFQRETRWTAILGVLFLMPALLVVAPGIAYNLSGVNFPERLGQLLGITAKTWMGNPWIILSGLAIALLINALPIFRFKFASDKSAYHFLFDIRKNSANLTLVTLGVVLGLSIVGYLIAENVLPLL